MRIKKYEKNGQTYFMFQAYAGIDPATGKQRGITRRGFSSQKDAEMEYYRLKLEMEEGVQKVKRYTFQEVYDLWIEEYRNTVKESTLQKTKTLFRCHILPVFGKMYIDMIKVNHCQDAINKWFKVLKNHRSVNSYAGLVFRHGIKLGIITTDPTKVITVPVRVNPVDEEEIINFYSKEELVKFLDCFESPKWSMYFRLLAYAGCRKSEALALTWKDINFTDNTISITKTLAVGLDNKIIVQPPKTKKGKRSISMDPVTMEKLRTWKKLQASEMLKLGFNTMKPGQLVFTNLKNRFINPQKVGQVMDAHCTRFGIRPITPHGLRHTHCSILFEAGASLKEVQDRLGHADIQTTMNIYAHVSEEKKELTAVKFAEYLSN